MYIGDKKDVFGSFSFGLELSRPHHAKGVYGIRNLLRYIINAEHCISSIPKELYIIIAKAMYEEPYSAAPFLKRALSVRYFIKVFSEKVLTKRKKLDIILWQVDNHTCGEVLKW